MFSLLTRRVTARTTQVARRTLFVTPQLNFVPPTATEKEVARKTAEKKTTKAKTLASAKKTTGESRAGKPKAEKTKQRVRIPKELKPPKRAPGPYFIFYASFVKSQPRGNTLFDFQELSKRAGEIWRGYSMAEKQPFYDESEARKAQAQQQRDDFFRNTSMADLKQLNAIRKAQGKTKFHSRKEPTIPPTPFIMFSNEFRNSSDCEAMVSQMTSGQTLVVRAVLAAADRWKSMSYEEKAPYFERYKKEKQEMDAERAAS